MTVTLDYVVHELFVCNQAPKLPDMEKVANYAESIELCLGILNEQCQRLSRQHMEVLVDGDSEERQALVTAQGIEYLDYFLDRLWDYEWSQLCQNIHTLPVLSNQSCSQTNNSLS